MSIFKHKIEKNDDNIENKSEETKKFEGFSDKLAALSERRAEKKIERAEKKVERDEKKLERDKGKLEELKNKNTKEVPKTDEMKEKESEKPRNQILEMPKEKDVEKVTQIEASNDSKKSKESFLDKLAALRERHDAKKVEQADKKVERDGEKVERDKSKLEELKNKNAKEVPKSNETKEKEEKEEVNLSPRDKIAAGEKGKKMLDIDYEEGEGLNKSFEEVYYEGKSGKQRTKELEQIRDKNKHHISRLETRAESLKLGIDGAKEKMNENNEPNNSEYQKYSKMQDEYKVEYAKALYMIGKLEENNKSIDREIGTTKEVDGNAKGSKMSVKERMQDFFERHKK